MFLLYDHHKVIYNSHLTLQKQNCYFKVEGQFEYFQEGTITDQSRACRSFVRFTSAALELIVGHYLAPAESPSKRGVLYAYGTLLDSVLLGDPNSKELGACHV